MQLKNANDPDGVEQAKMQFLNLAAEIDPFKPVRKHPYIAVGTAATLGAISATPAVGKTIQLSQIINRLVSLSLPMINQVISGARFAMHSRANQTNPPQQGAE